MLKRLRAAGLLLIALGLSPSSVQAAPIISAPLVTVEVGDIFTIPIAITDAVALTSWQFDLVFDPAIVQASAVNEGTFMSDFGSTLFGPGVIDNPNGLISIVTNAFTDFAPAPSGTGVVAEIEFLALAPGVSPLLLSNVFVNLLADGVEIANGQITVTGTPVPVPEPAMLTLLAGGLAVWARRGSRWQGARS
jgi:general secretion pathway protein D